MDHESPKSTKLAAEDAESANISENFATRAKAFLLDTTIPLWKRLLPLVSLLFLFVLYFSCGKETPPDIVRTPEDFMGPPDGDTGLVTADRESERLLAKLPPRTQKSEFDIDDLNLQEFDTREQKNLRTQQAATEAENQREAVARGIVARDQVAASTPFSSFPNLTKNPLEFALGPNGSVLVADRAALIQFDSELKNPEVLLDASVYVKEFNEEMPSLSALTVDDDGSIWLGFLQGQVARYHRFSWRMMLRAGEPVRGRVFDIQTAGRDTFIAGPGLWRWDSNFQRAISADGLQSQRFTSLLRTKDDTLFAAGLAGVWSYEAGSGKWRMLWKPRQEDGGAHTMIERRDGRLLIGTSNGIVELSRRGVVSDRLLVGEVISGIYESPKKELFVSTRQHGLFYWNKDTWFRAGKKQGIANRIDHLIVDSFDRLWLAASRDGLFVARLESTKQWISAFPEVLGEAEITDPKIFSNACDAATSVLAGITLSKGVALEVLDGKSYAFFDGGQVCPKGTGYRRPDGTVVIQQGWTLTVFREEAREVIEIPRQYLADQSSALYLDSQDRIWIGTTEHGLYRYADKEWQEYGAQQKFLQNRINKIQEDSTGRIWIASSPSLNQAKTAFLGDPITIFQENQDGSSSWKGISPTQRFGSWTAFDLIEINPTTMFVAGKNGISFLEANDRVHNIGTREKMNPVYAFSASRDGAGKIWIAHQFFGDGVSVFDGSSLRHIASKDGVFSDRIVDIAHDRHGRVWLLATTGQVAVYPRGYLTKRGTLLEIPPRKIYEIQ